MDTNSANETILGNKAVSPDTLFAQRFEYHRHLVNRRWQYILAYIFLTGALLSVWDKQNVGDGLRAYLAGSMIVTACAFVRLIARSRRRLRQNAAEMNKLAGSNVFEVAGSALSFKGISVWLYLCIFVFSLPWIQYVFAYSTLGGITVLIFYLVAFVSVLLPDKKSG